MPSEGEIRSAEAAVAEAAVAADDSTPTLGGKLLGALLRLGEDRHLTALVAVHHAPVSLVLLPDLGCGVVIVDRGDDDVASLETRLSALLRGHGDGILHLVVAGAREADRPALLAADRGAPDPNRLGVHLLSPEGKLTRIAGRRLRLLAEATALLPQSRPPTVADLSEHNTRVEARRQEAGAFAAALDHRPQRAIRVLGAACIVMFALTTYWGRRNFQVTLLNAGANSAPLVEAGQIWRLISHAFLHADPIHLIVNLIALFSFGGFLEGMLGWRRMAVLYTLSALGGGLASAFIGRSSLSVGASGAIWGLMAAGIAIVLRREAIVPPLISARLRPRLLGVLGLNLALSLLPSIDKWAHFGGGLVGGLLAGTGLLTLGLAAGKPPSDGPSSLGLRAASAICLAALLVAIATALSTGQPWHPQMVLEPDQLV